MCSGAHVLFIRHSDYRKQSSKYVCVFELVQTVRYENEAAPGRAGTLQYKIIRIQMLHFVRVCPTTKYSGERASNATLKAKKKREKRRKRTKNNLSRLIPMRGNVFARSAQRSSLDRFHRRLDVISK